MVIYSSLANNNSGPSYNSLLAKCRGRNRSRAREHCSPESFCASGKFVRVECNCQYIRKTTGLSGNFPDCLEIFQMVLKPSRLSGNYHYKNKWSLGTSFDSGGFPVVCKLSGNFLDCVQTFRKLSGNFLDYLQNFQIVCKLSGNFLDCLQTFRKLSGLSAKFPDCLQTFRKLSGLSENFPETFFTLKKSGRFSPCSGTFRIIWKLSRVSENFPDYFKNF